METFERMGVSGEGRPVRLMILRALESMCNKAARHDDKRRPPEQERRAMAAITRYHNQNATKKNHVTKVMRQKRRTILAWCTSGYHICDCMIVAPRKAVICLN
jgi:hypothetical protein